MLTAFKRGLSQIVVRPYGRNHRDSIHFRRPYKFVAITVDRGVWICCLNAFARCGSLVADPDHLAAFQTSQITHDIRPPVTVADDTKPNHKNSSENRYCLLNNLVR